MTKEWSIKDEQLFPKGHSSHSNRFYGYAERTIELPDGSKATYYGVDIPPTGHVVAVDDDLTTYLVRQRRPNLMRPGDMVVPTSLELPGGFLSDGIRKEDAVNNELMQETGLSAGSMMHIGSIYPSPGVSNEVDSIFLGRALKKVERVGYDTTEQDMEIVTERFPSLYDGLMSGKRAVSAQTLASIAMASKHL